MSLDHFVLWFTGVSCGEGGAIWVNIAGICRVLAILYICWGHLFDPMGVPLWCMHTMCTPTPCYESPYKLPSFQESKPKLHWFCANDFGMCVMDTICDFFTL